MNLVTDGAIEPAAHVASDEFDGSHAVDFVPIGLPQRYKTSGTTFCPGCRSARNCSEVGLVCANAFIMPQRSAKMKKEDNHPAVAPGAAYAIRSETRYTIGT
jgi:hypothetical protein